MPKTDICFVFSEKSPSGSYVGIMVDLLSGVYSLKQIKLTIDPEHDEGVIGAAMTLYSMRSFLDNVVEVITLEDANLLKSLGITLPQDILNVIKYNNVGTASWASTSKIYLESD